ncbi:MAG: hypothetical protein Tsb002_19300 [Wenzhouxiangellaceae bacterium]
MTTEPTIWRDYGGHHTRYQEPGHTISTLEQLTTVVREAAAHGQRLRLRGNGHSMNGLANPRPGECLLLMQQCNHYRFDQPGTITVGAGAAVWDVHHYLQSRGHGLYVYNDGGAAASSLGGYLAAGGFGQSSAANGGFWESVESITLVDGQGEVHQLQRDHPHFRWLFGSMGQLGVAFELQLRIDSPQQASYPLGSSGRIEASRHDWEPTLWYTLFVPEDDWQTAYRALRAIGSEHRHAWRGRWPYAYAIPFKQFNPPLITAHQGNLAAVGIWGDRPDNGFDWQAVQQIEHDLHALIADQPLWRRYLQTEYCSPQFDYAAYFGSAVFSQWQQLKQHYDPEQRLNTGVFCPAGEHA